MFFRVLIGFAVVIGGFAFSEMETPTPDFSREQVSPVLSLALAPSERTFDICGDCHTCDPEEMKFEALEGDEEDTWADWMPCIEEICHWLAECDVCCDNPPPEWCSQSAIERCGITQPAPSSEDLPEIWNTIVSNDVDEILRTIKAYPHHVVINEERRSIQMLGCAGVVVATVPVSEAQLAALFLGLK